MKLKYNLAILVPSCDKYSDLWDPLFSSIEKFWNPLPGNLYLLTNNLTPDKYPCKVIPIGDDKTWSLNVLNALSYIDEEYVMLHIDDLIITDYVDTFQTNRLISEFMNSNGNYLRLNPTPKGTFQMGFISNVLPGDLYRSSTVFSIWKKEVLVDILRPEENAWEFEILGSERTDVFRNWYASVKWLIPYENLVIKGLVDPLALRKINKSGIAYETNRDLMNFFQLSNYIFKRIRSKFLGIIPRRMQRSIRSAFTSSTI